MIELRQNLTERIPWAPSEMKKGNSQNTSPCCGSPERTCSPFPSCCNCPWNNMIAKNVDITIDNF